MSHMHRDDAIQYHVCEFASLADKLAETGIEMQKESFVIMFSASLLRSYNIFFMVLESRHKLLSLSPLMFKLAEEANKGKLPVK